MTRFFGLSAAVVVFALWGCDDEPDPVDCDAIDNPCDNEGDQRCAPDGDGVEECQEGTDGCFQWAESEGCGENQECDDTSDPPTCVCDETITCDDEGASFCDEDIVMECVEDDDGCLVEEDQENCASSGRVCDDTSGTAECAGCENTCETEGAYQCDGLALLQICAEQDEGCLAWEDDTNCADLMPAQMCDDASGTAQCVEGCADQCLVDGETQCFGDMIQTCGVVEGCMDWIDGEDCSTHDPSEECSDSSGTAMCVEEGCTDECSTDGDTQCGGDIIETCTMQDDGCYDWIGGEDCWTHEPSEICDDSSGTAECVPPPPGSCGDPVVVDSFPFELAGDDITADYTNSHTLAGTDCSSFGGTVDIVFSVDMLAGEEIVVLEFGGLDAILSLQESCGNDEACVFSDDYNETTGLGHVYTASADGTVYVIVETYSSSPFSVDYFVVIDTPVAEVCDDELDNDYDGETDCADADCAGIAPCEETEATCDDDFDNDADGSVDCADSDCAGIAPCEDPEETCDDDFDNDADGLIDCDDSDCFSADCAPESNCHDGGDNDDDGDVDCDDSDCAADVYCTTEGGCHTPVVVDTMPFAVTGDDFAADFLDQQILDGDGCYSRSSGQQEAVFEVSLVAGETVILSEHGDIDVTLNLQVASCGNTTDCEFGEDYGETEGHIYSAMEDVTVYAIVEIWSSSPISTGYDIRIDIVPPETECGDGSDNDMDELIDCDDPDCFGDATHCSAESNCDDGFDNDDDGDIDCADADCISETYCEDPEATCNDGFDNDGDEDVDCADSDCAAGTLCTTEGSCSLPIVVSSLPFTVTGADFTADYLNQQVFSDDSCYARSGDQSEAVFEVSLSAGEAINLSEHGGMDSVLSLQVATCDNDALCEFGVDLGTNETGGRHYVATEDVTVYAIVEVWSATPTSTDYDIRIEAYVPPVPVINEIVSDDDGTDDMEFVEIFYADGALDLTGYTLVHYNGDGGAVLWTADLTDFDTDFTGFFVIGPEELTAADANWFADFGIDDADEEEVIDNGADALVIYWDYGGSEEEVIDAVAFGGTGDLPAESIETAPAGMLDGYSLTSLGRFRDGEDTDDNSEDMGIAWFVTPGDANFTHDPEGYVRVSGSCSDFSSDTFPVEVPDDTDPGPSVSITIDEPWWPETIADLQVGVRVDGYNSDIEVTLESPDGTTVFLHDNTSDDIVTIYDAISAVDDATLTMDDFNGESGRGTWTLTVTDNVSVLGGSILDWYLLAN